uniref:Putative head-elevated expression protein n=1 Tax=Corethrella appendiculata TaxID=1370023 RepID=U5EQ92_9DIPT
MGASESRTVTIDNNNSPGVIDVSDEVVQRLKSGLKAEKQREQQQNSESRPISAPAHPPSSYTNPVPHPNTLYSEPSLTSMQVRIEKENELKKNDLYWAQRLKELETNLQKTNQIMEKQYNDAVADVKKRFENTTTLQQPAPCQELKNAVIECYKKNTNETLKCSAVVQSFTDCVNSHRIKLLANQK